MVLMNCRWVDWLAAELEPSFAKPKQVDSCHSYSVVIGGCLTVEGYCRFASAANNGPSNIQAS
jgi:hypothetical protein